MKPANGRSEGCGRKVNGVGTPYIPPMTRRLKCRIYPEQSPYAARAGDKPVRRGREMIDLLAVEEPKPGAQRRPPLYEAAIN